MGDTISRRDETDRWEINAVGLEEEILCEMCENPMHTDRGCDGLCSYDKDLYKRIIKVLNDRMKPLQPDVPVTNVGNMISRQAAIDALDEQIEQCNKALGSFDISLKDEFAIKVERASLKAYREQLENLPPVQPKRTDCEYCHTDRDGYVFPLEKNSHAFIDRDKIVLKAKGWRGEAKIKYCPICGRRLADGVD